MRITGTSSQIKIEDDDLTILIDGELVTDGFWAYTDTMRIETDSAAVDDAFRENMIQKVLTETKNASLKIYFD